MLYRTIFDKKAVCKNPNLTKFISISSSPERSGVEICGFQDTEELRWPVLHSSAKNKKIPTWR